MILPDRKLRNWASNGGLYPYNPENINSGTVDLCWSGRVKFAIPNNVGPKWSDYFEYDEFTLVPFNLYLMDTLEFIKIPDDVVGLLFLKSSRARDGMEHLHAGLFDNGFPGTGTLEVINMAPWPVVVKKGQRIVQMALMRMEEGSDKTYRDTGRYCGQNIPQESR